MQEQKDYSICPKCGMKYSINNTKGFCIYCGCNMNDALPGQIPINSSPQEGLTQSVNQPTTSSQKEKIPRGAIVFLVLSIIGILILPFSVQFGALWLIFGAFTESEMIYYMILYLSFGCAIASVVGLPISIINILLKGIHTKKCLLIVIILTIIGLCTPSIMRITGNVGLKTAAIEENKIIYQDDQYTVKQKKVEFNDKKVNIALEIDGNLKSIYYINGRINKCYLNSLLLEKNAKENNIYTVSITREQLDYYQITEPKEIELNLPLTKVETVTITIDNETSNIQQQLSFEEEGLLHQNEYFKMYYNPEFSHEIDLYIESLVSEDYQVIFNNLDFDTPGYMQSVELFKTKDYSIQHETIYSYACKNNLSYLKGEYTIFDLSSNIEIAKGTIDETYDSLKIDTRRCRA